jgi:tRNA1Val (adenine37-N6)-methyltransferase
MFHFKRFSLSDDRSSMKVGTDGVFLGIYTHMNDAKSVLDVGTGCGLIALMLAQKGAQQIDAIDIDSESCKQAKENFIMSPWNKKMNVIEDDFYLFSKTTKKKYDLIVSNPPYFQTGIRKTNVQKSRARHEDSLSFAQLCIGTNNILHQNGRLTVVIPSYRIKDFLSEAHQSSLHLQSILLIHPFVDALPNRYILELSRKEPGSLFFQRLFQKDSNKKFTNEYRKYVSEYLLGFYS